MLNHSADSRESWGALETIFIINITLLHPFLPSFFAFLYQCVFSFLCLFICFHTHTPVDKRERDFSVCFLMAKKEKRDHCGSGALDSIFNLVCTVSKMPSHSFFTWTQQWENCEILHFSCKHMWMCSSAKAWLCLVGVYNVCKENTRPWQFPLMLVNALFTLIKNGPGKPEGDPVNSVWCSNVATSVYHICV